MSANRRNPSLSHFQEPLKPVRGRCVAAFCFTWKIITCIVSHVTLVLLVVSYCVGGAYLFQHLEKPHEIEVKKGIHYMRLNLTEKIWRISDNVSVLNENDWTSDVKKDLANFEKQILTAMKSDGWDGDEDITTTQWTFAGSLFYSIIVITTIGYGHISPRTDWGKVTTIFYAIIGIPLMLLCLSNIGDVMATSFRFIYWRVCCYICTRKSYRGRHRRRSQRALKMQRYLSRSQPPISRRSMHVSSRILNSYSGGGNGLFQAYSDPELHRLERNCESIPANYLLTDCDGSDRYHTHDRYQSPRDIVLQSMRASFKSHTIAGRGHYNRTNLDNANELYNDPSQFAQCTVKRSSRFSQHQRRRDRLEDRHTVEREQHLSHSKQHFDSIENIGDMLRSKKRSMSVRSIRKNSSVDYKSRQQQQHAYPQSYHKQRQLERGLTMTNSRQTNLRAKSLDHRASATYYDTVNDGIGKTSVIANRYAVKDLELKEQRCKFMRSNSTPTASNSYHQQPQRHYQVNEKRTSFSGNSTANNTTDYHRSHRISRTPSHQSQVQHEMDEISYKATAYPPSTARLCHDRRHKKQKSEPLPPSPRIMSPMGFAVKRQIYSRSQYMHDDGSQYYDGEWSESLGEISPKDRPVPIWLCVFLVISYILGGAALFAYWEEWSFLDSAYFCFITLTTIGFGDFVPAKGVKDESEQSIAYCSLYLLFGIALLAMSFNLVQEEFIANVKEVARRLGILKDDDEDDDDDDDYNDG